MVRDQCDDRGKGGDDVDDEDEVQRNTTHHHIDNVGDGGAVRIALAFNGGLPQLELSWLLQLPAVLAVSLLLAPLPKLPKLPYDGVPNELPAELPAELELAVSQLLTLLKLPKLAALPALPALPQPYSDGARDEAGEIS